MNSLAVADPISDLRVAIAVAASAHVRRPHAAPTPVRRRHRQRQLPRPDGAVSVRHGHAAPWHGRPEQEREEHLQAPGGESSRVVQVG